MHLSCGSSLMCEKDSKVSILLLLTHSSSRDFSVDRDSSSFSRLKLKSKVCRSVKCSKFSIFAILFSAIYSSLRFLKPSKFSILVMLFA